MIFSIIIILIPYLNCVVHGQQGHAIWGTLLPTFMNIRHMETIGVVAMDHIVEKYGCPFKRFQSILPLLQLSSKACRKLVFEVCVQQTRYYLPMHQFETMELLFQVAIIPGSCQGQRYQVSLIKTMSSSRSEIINT